MLLQKGYSVTVYDLFNFGSETLFSCSFSSKLILIKGDIRDESKLKQSMENADVIIHLAAIGNLLSQKLHSLSGLLIIFV